MRLSKQEIKIIKKNATKIFGECKVFLFGSRVDDSKKGGDIDLYIIAKRKENLFVKKAKLQVLLEDLLEKPVDVIVETNKRRLIEQEALKGIEL